MPIYEYKCRECDRRFEYLLLSSSPAPQCPACNSLNLEQLISSVAVRSESTAQANLSAQHRKVADARGARQRDEHRQHHEHFEDPSQTKQDT